MAWDVCEPAFEAGINQLAILNRPEFVRSEPYLRPDSHLLVLQLQGETGMSVADKMAWLTMGDMACVPAGTPFTHTGKPKNPFSYIYITIADTKRWHGLRDRGAWVRPYESADYLYVLVRRLLDAHLSRNIVALEHANRDSYALADLLLRETRMASKQDTPVSLALRDLMEQIRTKPEARWNNVDMASSVKMSERTFLRVFRQEFGTSPKTMVIKQRMIIARQLLEYTDDPIKQIASDLGYTNRRTFTALFSSYTGVTPEEFRRKVLTNRP